MTIRIAQNCAKLSGADRPYQSKVALVAVISGTPAALAAKAGTTGSCLLLGRAYEDKDVQEQIVRRSGLDWTIVRPVILTNGPKTGTYRAMTDARDWRCGFISRADVADFLVRQIDDSSFFGATPVLSD
jgi:uncharacterized protein YbjT (DUF2867 family)